MARTQSSKLDELIRLSRERDAQIANLSAEFVKLTATVAEQARQIAAMQPTVSAVAEQFTFAKVGKTYLRLLIGAGAVGAPVLFFMSDRWHLLAQFFKRIP